MQAIHQRSNRPLKEPALWSRNRWAGDFVHALRGPAVGVPIAGLTVFLGFSAGGFFPGATAIAALVVCLLTVLGIMLVSRPFESFTPGLLVPLALLAGFAVGTLVSAAWSDASGRALLEFDRALLYVLVFAFFGMLVPGKRRLEWGLRGFVVAAVAICGAGWITRVAADVWPISLDVQPERLSFPLTYWNALGLMATLAIVACVHLSSGERQSRLTRTLGAAAVPLLASTLLLTFSRASLALAVIGVLIYAAIARPRRLLSTLVAVVPATAVALVASYRAVLIASAHFASPPAVAQGHRLAFVVGLCVGGATLLRFLLLRFDGRLEAWRPPEVSARTKTGVAAGIVAIMVAITLALGVPSRIETQYRDFVHGNAVGHHQDPRARLTSSGNNGRIPQWDVALDAFEAKPLAGSGAGTYQLLWAQHRPYLFTVIDAHSLYIQVLGELGVVGILLIGGALIAILVGLARRMRGEERHVYAAVLAIAVVWAIHAGVDWDWEMPAVTLWLFALAGLGLAKPVGERSRATAIEPGRMVRIVAALCVGVLAVTPAAVAVSQSNLNAAVSAFDRNDCGTAINSALDSLDALKVRPEPYEVIGYCDARLGQDHLALLTMENAVSRDPNNWETHYGLAIARAAAALDPLPQLRLARRLNPLEPMIQEEIRSMTNKGPLQWKRRAKAARLPL
jgi:O-antigen ligase